MKRAWVAIKHFFSHPYGVCHVEGCDKPCKRSADWCDYHWGVRICKAREERLQAEFDRQVEIVVEGIRRAKASGQRIG